MKISKMIRLGSLDIPGIPRMFLTADVLQDLTSMMESLLDKGIQPEQVAKEVNKKYPMFGSPALLPMVQQIQKKKQAPKKKRTPASAKLEAGMKKIVDKHFSKISLDYELGDLPKIEEAVKKFGIKKMSKWMDNVDAFVRMNKRDPEIFNTLTEMKDVFQFFKAEPDIPPKLYRGIRVEEDPGDFTTYNATKRPHTSWTTDREIAEYFARGEGGAKGKHGLVVTVPGSEIAKQDIMFWPFDIPEFDKANFGEELKTENEWLVRMKEPVKVIDKYTTTDTPSKPKIERKDKDGKLNPDQYRKEHGKCPKGYRWSGKHCVPTKKKKT